MHRLIPGFIQEQFVRGQSPGSFQAAALFVDISGFTAITDALMGQGQHGAEVLATIIQDIFDPLTESVFDQGGFVTNLAGDAFTAIFPAETLSPEVYQRALAAAWHVQQVMADLAQYLTRYGNFTLSVKVGLADGEVAWGILASADELRAAYYFQGPAIDGCALAERMAGAGQVIASPTFYSAIESMVEAEVVEDHYRITTIDAALPSAQPFALPAVDPDVMGRFFPPEAWRPALGGEFRQVVGMFVSLPTVRTSEQLELFMQTVFELLDRYGGLLNRLDFGDKGASLLLFWGAPVAHENDVIRALNFILDLQSQTVVPVNAGITYQIAHVGYSGGRLAGEYTCHGRGLSLAARMMQACPRGEIWVDEGVAERARFLFEVEFAGAMAFKGFTEAQKVFAVLERKQEIDLVYEGQMVGRQAEQGRLVEFVAPIWGGHCPGIMIIWGEPGIGKSRLVHNFLRHLEESAGRDFAVFVCQTDEILRESFNPFRYWLRKHFGQSEQQSEIRNKRNFNRLLDQLIASSDDETLTAELDRTRSFLGALIDLEWPDSLYNQLDARGRYENSFASLLTLLKVESRQRPVILLLEDAQWLDADSGAFIRQVVQDMDQNGGYPLAILATARPGEQQMAFLNGVTFQEIDLAQLSPDDLVALAEQQLGAPLRPDLLQRLVDRTEGNPLFAEQILRYLQEQDQLVQVNGRWGIKAGQEDILPDDVRAVLVARLDRLTRDVKEVVQTASVIGREFEFRLLARLLNDDPALREKVAQAEQVAIWSALNELRYLFKHTLLRDAAYRMQVRSRRQALHALAAQALETLYADDLSAHYGELAHHTELAGLDQAARVYLEQAGNSSKDAYKNNQAIDYYSRALSLTPDEDLESRYRLLLARAGRYGLLGARQEQWQDLSDLADLAAQLDDVHKRAKSLLTRAWFHYWTANYPEALAAARQATDLAKGAEEHQLTADGYSCSTWVLVDQGDFDGALPLAEQALHYARLTGDPEEEARMLGGLGVISRGKGDYFAAREYAAQELAIIRKLQRKRLTSGYALGNFGVCLMNLGDYQSAQEYFAESLRVSRDTGRKTGIASALINLSWHAQAVGEWDLAIQYGQEGIALVLEFNQSEFEAEGQLWLGHGWLGLGDPDRALVAYSRSLALRRQLGQEFHAMEVLAGMARAAAAQGDLDLAVNYVTDIVSYTEAGGSLIGTWEPLRIYLSCYQILRQAQDPRAEEILETAYQELQSLVNRIPDAATRERFLEAVPWHREILVAHRSR